MPKIFGAKDLSADGIRAVVTGTPGAGKAVVDDGASGLEWAATAGVPQALDTTDSPQFAGVNIGHASDTTLARTGPGVIAVEGVEVTLNTATQTLSGKTLTAPKLADGGFIADANGNELLIGDTVASAVNEVTLANAATGTNPKLSATGGDTNIGIDLQAKGTGPYNLLGTATSSAEARLYEDTDNGTNYVGLKAPASVASSLSLTLPATTGAGKVLTDVAGDGVLSMETPSGGGVNQLAIFRRTGTNQTGVSGSSAYDYIQYNTESSDEGNNWSVSGDDFTCATTGRYLIIQQIYVVQTVYLNVVVNGVEDETLVQPANSFQRIPWIVSISSGQTLKFRLKSSVSETIKYAEGSVPDGYLNFVEIWRLA